MREGIQIHFHDHSMMVDHIDTYNDYANLNQSDGDILEDVDFEEIISDDIPGETPKNPVSIPDELNTPAAIEWLGKIQFAGWLDEHLQPVKLTVAQMGCIVVKAQYELGLNACWKDFATLWDMNKDSLRTGFMSGQDTKQTKAFNKKLNEV